MDLKMYVAAMGQTDVTFTTSFMDIGSKCRGHTENSMVTS
jgi:hypothetical protein